MSAEGLARPARGMCLSLRLRRRRAGHARGESDRRPRGHGGSTNSFHLSAQDSPLLMVRVNFPVTRPGVVPHRQTCTPRNRQYAGG
ncbi:hypothetical protein B1R27_32375 [Streptomyces sp. GKU 895]|nr:hypothetical protein B1R27_32375 [Streptomyces sp. GKU 895]